MCIFFVHPYTQPMTTLDRWLPLIGRLLFAFIFPAAAPRRFTGEGITHAADLGVSFADFFVPLSGILAIAGALFVSFGFRAQWGAWHSRFTYFRSTRRHAANSGDIDVI
jgi:uncharacterized membrane protein YphA (DoxX/SURF4 family)